MTNPDIKSHQPIEPQLVIKPCDKDAVIELLRSWCEGDEQEQQETWDYLKRALDEDRLSDRKFFR